MSCKVKPVKRLRLLRQHKSQVIIQIKKQLIIMAIEEDETFAQLLKDKSREGKKKARQRSTDMLLTLNLNEQFDHMSKEQKQKFRDFAVDLFDKKDILTYFQDRFSPGNPLANIENVEIKWKPEIGPKTGRLHLHALVAIEHHGFLSFKANRLRDHALKVFGHGIYLNCPISSNERIKWVNYLNKGFGDAEIDKS